MPFNQLQEVEGTDDANYPLLVSDNDMVNLTPTHDSRRHTGIVIGGHDCHVFRHNAANGRLVLQAMGKVSGGHNADRLTIRPNDWDRMNAVSFHHATHMFDAVMRRGGDDTLRHEF
jgi:hypothetical protein